MRKLLMNTTNLAFIKFGMILLGLVMLLEALGRYWGLTTNIADLGIFQSDFFSMRSEWQRAFTWHVQPLMLIWGNVYELMPMGIAPYVLIGSQVGILLISALYIYKNFGWLPALALMLYLPFWRNALFDFHFDHLAIPILTAYFIFCKKEKYVVAAACSLSLCLIKEPYALQTVSCGIYFAWLALQSNNQKDRVKIAFLALIQVLFGIGWFYVAINLVMPYFSDGTRGALDGGAFSWLGASIGSMILNLITHPLSLLGEVLFTPKKIIYLLVIFGSLGFLPLLKPAKLIVALPPILIALLARQENYYSYAAHYTAGVAIPAILAFQDAAPAVIKKLQFIAGKVCEMFCTQDLIGLKGGSSKGYYEFLILCPVLLTHFFLVSSPFGLNFWSDKLFEANRHAYVSSTRDRMIKNALELNIPISSEVAISAQNSINWGNMPYRRFYYPFPMGVLESQKHINWGNRSLRGFFDYVYTGQKDVLSIFYKKAEYIVLDAKRPIFYNDMGCGWLYGACTNLKIETDYKMAVDYAFTKSNIIFENDGFVILKARE